MKTQLLKGAFVVNEGIVAVKDVLIKNGRIEKIESQISTVTENHIEWNLDGLYLMPGVIDDQVHFREPGLTHKADLYTESRAAVAGGVTTYMEMPNTKPPTFTQELLEAKYTRASQVSLANYSFYMGTSNDNYDEIMKTDFSKVCGLKIFMGSSTGNLLVDDDHVLSKLFANVPSLIATHCEDEQTILLNTEKYTSMYGATIPIKYHPEIRSVEACYLSSSKAIKLAKKHNTRLHILHISSAKECAQFDNQIPIEQKRITSEACIHHLYFSDADYEAKGNFIKWNPAIKTAQDREAIWQALLDNRIDIIATDHAPHTIEEKQSDLYKEVPGGGPLIQHSLQVMIDFYKQGKISLERIVEKMCHSPAICFQVKERGYIREGYYADLCAIDLNNDYTVSKSNILYKCGWSPFEGTQFRNTIKTTWVNGFLAYHDGTIYDTQLGQRINFNR